MITDSMVFFDPFPYSNIHRVLVVQDGLFKDTYCQYLRIYLPVEITSQNVKIEVQRSIEHTVLAKIYKAVQGKKKPTIPPIFDIKKYV